MSCGFPRPARTRVMKLLFSSRPMKDRFWSPPTSDKDFGELVFVFNKPHSTIIRLVDIPARDQGKMLLRLIETHQDSIDKKALITVDRHRVRIRLTDKTE